MSMNHVLAVLALAALAVPRAAVSGTEATEASTNSTPAAITLRVAQWNIGHFAMGRSGSPTVKPENSAARAAEYRAKIAALGVDFLGVSEYDPAFDTAGTPSEKAVFAAFESRIPGPKNGYQCNAVFSRFPCLRSEVVDFKTREQGTYFLDTVFEIGGREVHVVQTHLDWNSSEAATDARPTQIRQLIRRFHDMPYVILCGDFNVYGAGEYFPFLMDGWRLANCGPEAGCIDTYVSPDKRMPCRRIPLDNVIVKGFRVKSVSLDDFDFTLSDHRTLVATIEMQ